MACPDELTLDLWLAGALSPQEAATVAAHVPTCAACTLAEQAVLAFDGKLQAALVLDADERAYLAGLQLASGWDAAQSATPMYWSWLSLFGGVAALAVWI